MRDLLVVVPSRGRPDRLGAMLEACLSLSEAATDIAVATDDDDLAHDFYAAVTQAKGTGRVCWHHGPRDTVAGWTNRVAVSSAPCYRALASLSDDHMPRTPGWDRLLLAAIDGMGGTGISYGNDLLQGKTLCTAAVLSSDIVTALGWMAQPSMRHYRIDDVWKELGRRRRLPGVPPGCDHRALHPGAGKAVFDATYAEEFPRSPEDDVAWEAWRAQRKAADVATVAALKTRKADACCES